MEKYIKIESKGIIQEEAFTLLGASTKKNDATKIGFFGSGLKYSIAYMLRNGVKFKVFADYSEVKFSTEKKNFRNVDFDVICVNGQQTSMATSMGSDWEAWFILREIYCNALDEGESEINVVNEIECIPVEDKTVFYIQINSDFEEIIKQWNLYFSEKRQDILYFDFESNQIYNGGESLIIYRKGIQCYYAAKEKSSFNYDMSWVEINESRVIKNDWDFRYSMMQYLQKITDKKIISHLLNTVCDTYEKGFLWYSTPENYSDEWLACLNNKTLVPIENAGYWHEVVKEEPLSYITLPSNLITGLKSRFADLVRVIGDVDSFSGGGKMKIISDLTAKQSQLLNDAKSFLKSAKYDVKYEIKIVDFVDKSVLGQAKDENILLSQRLFEKGRKQIAACIIEENEHLITGFNDETRAFQNHFIWKYLELMEEKTNTYL